MLAPWRGGGGKRGVGSGQRSRGGKQLALARKRRESSSEGMTQAMGPHEKEKKTTYL